jgi:hypothetical protein
MNRRSALTTKTAPATPARGCGSAATLAVSRPCSTWNTLGSEISSSNSLGSRCDSTLFGYSTLNEIGAGLLRRAGQDAFSLRQDRVGPCREEVASLWVP